MSCIVGSVPTRTWLIKLTNCISVTQAVTWHYQPQAGYIVEVISMSSYEMDFVHSVYQRV